ncbi:hypothetical protein GGX14DRAFT_520458 [Mycena pura]|uniref:FAD/NAD(P)-binding domain-containing protein n=1 Tax=Mycena pura TaxID=153505 RepID=A0AAD6VHZ4_9AGAR|nr:hypothetical protein GGX14DRAFT_520458 [Mycena pura]
MPSLLLKSLVAIPAVYSTLLLAWHLLRRHLLAKNIGTCSLPSLQTGRHPSQKIEGTAVICGGSIAGLLAARICHEHFERVVIVEPEPWVASEEGRKVDGWVLTSQRSRVMQYASFHGCQVYFLAGMRHLFPNLEEECYRSNIKIQSHNLRFNLSGSMWRTPSALREGMYVGRAGIETFLRRLVLDRDTYPNIEFITGTVTDVLPDPTNPSRLSKVIVRKDSSGAVHEFPAALVADCTGPARVGLKWLARHGYGSSTSYPGATLPLDQLKISFDQKLRYSSMLFRISPEFHNCLPLPADLKDMKPIYTFIEDATGETLAKGRATFILMRADGDQLVAFAGHYGTARPQPKSLRELKEYARDLYAVTPIPDWVFKLLDMLEEIEDSAIVSLVKVPPTTYVRYHRATNLPSNFVALGDSVMTVNPVFGEGCTKALRCAIALHTVLLRAQATSGRTLPATFATDFFAEEHAKTGWLWENTRVMDYGAPSTEPIAGESLQSGAFLRWYANWLQRLAATDGHAGLVMYELTCGFASPIDGFHPSLILKILWRAVAG